MSTKWRTSGRAPGPLADDGFALDSGSFSRPQISPR